MNSEANGFVIMPNQADLLVNDDIIRSRIFTLRGVQVILDRDLAMLYGVDVKRINEQVKRNSDRFPEDFMFRLTKDECLRSQIATLNMERGKHMKYMPYAFTESGVAMLSGVLRSSIAVDVNIRIMRAFVSMRRALASIAPVLARVSEIERVQLEEKTLRQIDQRRNEERFDTIFRAMDGGDFPPQKVFFDGQVYDAFEQMKKFVRMAKKELIIIDPYFADSVLSLIAQKRKDVEVVVIKNSRNKLLHDVDVAQFNAQYANSLTVKVSDRFHDRFLIIDKTTLIHVGASLNHLGKKCFAFSSLDKSNIPDILAKI
jgi:hypothetical protein